MKKNTLSEKFCIFNCKKEMHKVIDIVSPGYCIESDKVATLIVCPASLAQSTILH